MNRLARFGLVGSLLFFHSVVAPTSGFAESVQKAVTFSEDLASAQVVLFGTFANPQLIDDETWTDFVINSALKTNPILKDRTIIQIPRYIPVKEPHKPPAFVVFGEVVHGKIDLYRGVPADQRVIDYLRPLMKIDAKDRVQLLRYCFDFLEHPEPSISEDAYQEFSKASDAEIRLVAPHLSAESLRHWIRYPKIDSRRRPLFCVLLAHCGKTEDAILLRECLDQSIRESSFTGFSDLLRGYTLLDPKAGWAYTRSLAVNPKNEFILRYAGLRTADYFQIIQRDVIPEQDILEFMRLLLRQSDMADLPIDYLRRWKCWKLTREILPLFGHKDFDLPIIRRSIIRYALQCPDPACKQFIRIRRKIDPKKILELEEGLILEARLQEKLSEK